MAKQEREVERWITVNGVRVPIFKDGSVGGPKALRDKVKVGQNKKQADAAKSNHEKYLEVKERLAERNAMDERKEKISKQINKDNGSKERLSVYERQLAEVNDELANAPKSKALRNEEGIKELEKKKAQLEAYIAKEKGTSTKQGIKNIMDSKDGTTIQVEHFSSITGKPDGTTVEYTLHNGRWSSKGYGEFDNNEKGFQSLNSKNGVVPKIQTKEQKIISDNEDLKEKQIKQNEAERDRLNGKATNNNLRYYTESQLNDETFRKEALDEMKRYERNWSYYSKKEKQNISPNGVKELRNRIKEIENYGKSKKRK